MSWRAVLVHAAALALAVMTVSAPSASAQVHPPPLCDGGPNGTDVFGVEQDGSLFAYRHFGAATGSGNWGAKRYIGEGWHGTVRAAGHGTFFFIPIGTGELRRYHWDGTYWDNFGDTQYEIVGHGFDRYVGPGRTLSATGDDTFYGIDDSGELRSWTQTDGQWQAELIGVGWHTFTRVIAGNSGEFYAFGNDGTAYLYQYARYYQRWDIQALPIGHGWTNFTNTATAGSGVLYTTTPTGTLLWYRHYVTWTYNGVPQQVGTGWQGITFLASPASCLPHPA
ncbi:tachylectin-related carbohydrate-binding protein [Actinokineospora diospyrosa]|uniref:Tachylectin n=1 Tax=Actinokineospora diospyrosa TaxID=103728 RepID=A0ABT1IN74_9PSEU|nr:tachylectin-related carbohydrate-binding protein [Actinokineospora diospyrosa]MCP2274124.1 Tachylectin [Actinokineospora diospyrosa]